MANTPAGLHLPPALPLPLPPPPHLAYSLLPTSQCGPWVGGLRKESDSGKVLDVERGSLIHWTGNHPRQKSPIPSTAKSHSERDSSFMTLALHAFLGSPTSNTLLLSLHFCLQVNAPITHCPTMPFTVVNGFKIHSSYLLLPVL